VGARKKAVQLGDEERDAVFMTLGERKFSFVNRKPGHWQQQSFFVCGGQTCKTSSLPPPTVTGQLADKISLLLLCLSLFPLAYS